METIATAKTKNGPLDGLAAATEREGLLRAVERLEAAMAALDRALADDVAGYAPDGFREARAAGRAAASR